MTQDLIVTLIAMSVVAGFGVRWWRRRGRREFVLVALERAA